MTRPRLLDLFCGAGGAAMGYHRAGFDVTGVDINPQPRYPFEFHQADALKFMDTWLSMSPGWLKFDAIHASPPCQAYSMATPEDARSNHPDLVAPVRDLLIAAGVPWVIENVPGAPMRVDLKLCGCMFGLPRLKRERWFETWPKLFDLRQPCQHIGGVIGVHGGGGKRNGKMADRVTAMGIDWMTRDELNLAIPPAYTEHIGRQLLEHLAVSA